eukprot:scaffold7518_cov350-Prasinococcus_capsulatus_cf.AAC.2
MSLFPSARPSAGKTLLPAPTEPSEGPPREVRWRSSGRPEARRFWPPIGWPGLSSVAISPPPHDGAGSCCGRPSPSASPPRPARAARTNGAAARAGPPPNEHCPCVLRRLHLTHPIAAGQRGSSAAARCREGREGTGIRGGVRPLRRS